MVYQSKEGISIRPFPDATGGISGVSGAKAAWNPQWRVDDQEIFYAASDGIMGVSVKFGKNGPEPSPPRVVWQGALGLGNRLGFNVSRDGQQLLVARAPQSDTETPLTVIVNWTRLLGER
jgi:hypothetical protein